MRRKYYIINFTDMKNLIILVICFVLFNNLLFSEQKSSTYSFSLGLLLPGKSVFLDYPGEKIETTDSLIEYLISDLNQPKYGYAFYIKFGVYLTSNLIFNGGIGYNRFNSNDLKIYYDQEQVGGYDVINTLIPISVDINYFINKSFINTYLITGINYNYINKNLNNIDSKYILKLPNEQKKSNLSLLFGVGNEIQIRKNSIFIETNFIIFDILNNKDINLDRSIIEIKTGIRF
jgi:hypothetical protein